MKALLLKMNHKNKNGIIYPKITVEVLNKEDFE